MEYRSKKKAFVLLADGTQFFGKSIGIEGSAFGEICFNTGMTGYQEIFTDPSYFGQLMVTTNTHIGNYGILNKESQSKTISISGLICKDFSFNYFIAADVLLYVGDLSAVFQLIKSRNKSNGRFVFSTEHTDDNKEFFLEKSGRYSHSKNYIENL